MEYTIKKVAELSGISTRTLRYYDEIDLLKPARINSSGYRIYGTKEIDRLQQILFYRSLDMKLEEIQKLLATPDFDPQHALQAHYQQLLEKRQQIDHLILTVEKTLRYQKGEITMTDKEKFIGFKQAKLKENEELYGKEIRENYGEETVTESNKQWLNLSEADFSAMEAAEKAMFDALKIVMKNHDLQSQTAKTVFEKHKEWLTYTSPVYSAEMHRGLGQMYVGDERFAAYYDDRVGIGTADMLNQVIQHFAK
ncbi:MerR family transcriptional regulator [Candidatus Enterococcus ikei]|uniref:MerR family transcriptional regulator n=1 Tax=Candidatus Enterococcus ikei TaxID=2815326 RepID=A0ABS3GUC7_9ENTE|nr:MerR family transcriptional regulator [Enterococcus sp. DIV0869a]MBO0438853.1 MerR family transcriptional regulator [Enterococcus sp. DIV0869a]